MQRIGLNKGAYFGERIEIQDLLRSLRRVAAERGWLIEEQPIESGLDLLALERPASASSDGSASARRAYISTGIHGDEPAGPLAALRLVREDAWPANIEIRLLPCLNPAGFERNTRQDANGIDLNRDYLQRASGTVRAHIGWLDRQPSFDLSLCLHEDWEAAGFYVYELNPDGHPSIAEQMVVAVAPVCPIETAKLIDGREAHAPGIIRPNLDPASRPQWPEAFYLITHKTRLSYTLEAPSDFSLETRVEALVRGARAAIEALGNSGRSSRSG